MSALQWLLALIVVAFERLARRGARPGRGDGSGEDRGRARDGGRIVPAGTPSRLAENVVLVLLGLACLFALGFIAVYAVFSASAMPNELLGIAMGMALVCIGAALAVFAKRLVVTEELEDDYPQPHPAAQREVLEIVRGSGSRITRKRLLMAAGGATGGALALAAITPVASLGPIWDTSPLDRTPWRRGVRLVDGHGRPLLAADVVAGSFYTAFPEGASLDLLGSPLIVVRVDPAELRLPRDRASWAPEGIVAYSKICTHAGCAVALYRKPTFGVVEPQPAFVCPCHYSTFDPFTGGTVLFGPAGRALPQLPLQIDAAGNLRAAGSFSARIGPSWWNVRERPT